jgi:hypothetical protein
VLLPESLKHHQKLPVAADAQQQLVVTHPIRLVAAGSEHPYRAAELNC